MPGRATPFIVAALVATSIACHSARSDRNQVTVMQTEPPRSMDPADHTATYTSSVLDPMYEGLTHFNQQLQIIPALGTEWQASADGLTWTVKLRPNVTFHDGTKFDSDAVTASFRRMLDRRRGLAGASLVRAIVAAVHASDTQTVQFTLNAPYAAFPSLLAVTEIVSPAADKAGILGRHAVGTGPYKFVEWNTGEYVLEARNDRYWGTKPSVKQIKWTWTNEPALLNMAVQSREADLVSPLPPIFAQALGRNRKIDLLEGRSSAVFWVALNTKSKPLNDVRVRQALNYGTDRTSLVQSLLRGYGTPANSPLAPADFGYSADIKGYGYDLAKARTLLAQAGYPNGFALSIAVQEAEVNIAQALQGMWAKAGIDLTIRQMETGVFSQAAFGDPEQKAHAGIQSVFASWSSANLDADYQLGPLYRTKSWSPAGANLGFYSNPKLDGLLDRASAELDIIKRRDLYREAQQIINDDAPHVTLYYSKDLAAERKGINGIWIFPGGRLQAAGVSRQP